MVGLTLFLGRAAGQVKQDTGAALLVQAITLAADVEGRRGMEKAIPTSRSKKAWAALQKKGQKAAEADV
jgi:hypothetical protein